MLSRMLGFLSQVSGGKSGYSFLTCCLKKQMSFCLNLLSYRTAPEEVKVGVKIKHMEQGGVGIVTRAIASPL